MKVSELGEFGLIDLLTEVANSTRERQTGSWKQLVIGIGDDAAAWQSGGSTQLATVDSLIQDVHFSFSVTTWEDLGWKALAVNLSDIAAMGGVPNYALVSLALPGDTETENVAALYRGMVDLARIWDVAIVGGNISRAPLVAITVCVLGSAEGQRMLTRNTARIGEQVAVTGHLGVAAAGLEMLTGQLKLEEQASELLRNAFLRPCPRLAEGQLLAEEGVTTAIDISDGLVSDLAHICQQSRVGARIEIDRVPVHPIAKDSFGDRALELALSGGEDYEILFTASTETVNRVKGATATPITVIGEVVADRIGEVTVADGQGVRLNPGRGGWEHFSPDEPRFSGA